VYEIQEIARSL